MMQGAVQLQPTDSQKLSGSDEIIIKAEDLESVSASSSCCRICLENDRGDELISPCMCKGTQKFVHRSCLDHWRSLNDGSFAFSNCTTCNAQFHLPEVEQPVGDYFTVWHAFLMLQFVSRSLSLLSTYCFLVAPVLESWPGFSLLRPLLDCWQLYIHRLLPWRPWWHTW